MSDTSQALSPSRAIDDRIDPFTSHQIAVRPSPEVQSTNMDGETVLLDLSTDHHTIRDIHTILCDRFDVAPERALDDLVTLVNQLTQEGLLQQERR